MENVDSTAVKNKCQSCGVELAWSEFHLFRNGKLLGPFCMDCYGELVDPTPEDKDNGVS